MELVDENLKRDILLKLKNNNYNFNELFPNLINDDYALFNDSDYSCFEAILELSDNNEDLKNKFVDFVFSLLCNYNFNQDEEKVIKDALYKEMKNNEKEIDLYRTLFVLPNALKTLCYLKFRHFSIIMNFLKGISPRQILLINKKHIIKIFNCLENSYEHSSKLYGYAIKLYLIFGYERTLKIINGQYGKLNEAFFENLEKTDVSEIQLFKEGNKYFPQIDQKFINFMFAKERDNHFINMLNNPSSLLNNYWFYLYNNFEKLKEKCHNEMSLKKVNIILEYVFSEKDTNFITPDNYKLKENDILPSVFLGNISKKSNEEIYKILLEIYGMMKFRVESSIPYVTGKADEYFYEMMKLNDPIVFALGYKINCCLRVGDIVHNDILHATLCRNGRILLIYNNKQDLVAFSILKRNGEVLIASNIECINHKDNKVILAFNAAMKEIVNITKKSESEPIKLVCIGSGSRVKPNGIPFPSNLPTPKIYEKNDIVYCLTDKYHKIVDIIYQDSNLDLTKIQYGDPKHSYVDPRNNIVYCDFLNDTQDNINNALNVINAVHYSNYNIENINNYKYISKDEIKYCIYNDDWYIFIDYNDNIFGEYLNINKESEKEFLMIYNEIKNNNKHLALLLK